MSDNPHKACPFVDCGSSDAFNWNDDGYGYCHSCGESYPSKNRLDEKSLQDYRYRCFKLMESKR